MKDKMVFSLHSVSTRHITERVLVLGIYGPKDLLGFLFKDVHLHVLNFLKEHFTLRSTVLYARIFCDLTEIIFGSRQDHLRNFFSWISA
jgi:hypothetical protein